MAVIRKREGFEWIDGNPANLLWIEREGLGGAAACSAWYLLSHISLCFYLWTYVGFLPQ